MIENLYTENDDLKEAVEKFGVALADFCNLLMPVVEAAAEIVGRTFKWLAASLPSICDKIGDVMEQIISLYPNKRVLYLVTHGKPRTRKKNINRIKKYFERQRKNRA